MALIGVAATAAVPFAAVSQSATILPPEVQALPVVLLHDLGSGQSLHARQADLRFVPASLTKVMTAYVAFELIAAGKLRPEQTFRVAPGTSSKFAGSGAALNLRDGEVVSVDMLLQGLATVSANDAALALAEGHSGSVAAWCGLMNAEARKLGLKDSHFASPSGWPDGGRTWVSARDMARLGEALIYRHPALYRRYFGKKTIAWPRASGRNHDPVTGVVAGADGIKTGHTREAGYNFLGSAERGGRRMIMLVAGGQSSEQRAAASRALLEWGFANWQAQSLFSAGAIVGEARVQNGAARRVALNAPYAIHALRAQGSEPGKASLRLLYQGPLVAPIAKGQQVAELEVTSPGMPAGRVPLYAAESVAEAGPIDRLVNGLAGLVS